MITTKACEFFGYSALVFIISVLFLLVTQKWWHRLLVIIVAVYLIWCIGDECSAKFPEFISCPKCNQIIYPTARQLYSDNMFVVKDITYLNYYCEKCDRFFRVRELERK